MSASETASAASVSARVTNSIAKLSACQEGECGCRWTLVHFKPGAAHRRPFSELQSANLQNANAPNDVVAQCPLCWEDDLTSSSGSNSSLPKTPLPPPSPSDSEHTPPPFTPRTPHSPLPPPSLGKEQLKAELASTEANLASARAELTAATRAHAELRRLYESQLEAVTRRVPRTRRAHLLL